MKCGGVTPMRCFVLGLMPLMGASTKTMKEIEQVFSAGGSFFDQGLGRKDLDLQVIESSLMSMVREGTSPSLLPGIEAIYSLTTDMKAAVENKSNHEQANLTQAWYDWLNCTANPAGRQSSGTFPVTPIHDYCWRNDSSEILSDWDGNRYYGGLWSWFYDVCRQNCTETCEMTNEITRETCPQTPFSCEKQWAAFDTNTDVKDHMVYLQSVFAGNMVLESNCSRNFTNCTSECHRECPPAGNISSANCSIGMCLLENEGCEKINETCEGYKECYNTEQEDYNETKAWVSSQEYSNKQEYRAILRIECLLNAFVASINQTQNLSDGIDGCINTTFYIDDQTFFGNVTIRYYNEAENPLKACTEENFPGVVPSFSVVPGSTQWQQTYYAPYIHAGVEPPTCSDPIHRHLIPECSNQ